MDFSCLFRYPGPKAVEDRIWRLESTWPAELEAAKQAMLAAGKRISGAPTWGRGTEPRQRPTLPTTEVYLGTPHDFLLMFGADAVHIYHPLRWMIFLTKPELQPPMLAACRALMRELQGRDAVITRDESPIILAFDRGASYDECLAAGAAEPAVAQIGDMYLDTATGGWDSAGYWRMPPSSLGS
jgi:hypothetical protein